MKRFFVTIFLLATSQTWAQNCLPNLSPSSDEQTIAAASAAAQISLNATLALAANLKKKQTPQFIFCVRGNAQAQLGAIDRLLNQSRFYEAPINTLGDAWFDLGSSAVTQDFLVLQIARAQVLLDYAAPYVALQENTDGVYDVRVPQSQTSHYWKNSFNELNRYVQAKDMEGQVGALERLIQSLAATSKTDCKSWKTRYQSPAFFNDIFSAARFKLEKTAQLSCK